MSLFHVKQIAQRALPLVLLAAVTVGACFAVREIPDALSPNPEGLPDDTTAIGTGTPDIPRVPSDAASAPAVVTVTPQTAHSKEQILSLSGQIPFTRESVPAADALTEAGFSVSAESYADNTSVLAFAEAFDFLPKSYAHTFGTKYILTYERPTEMSEPVPIYTATEDLIPVIEPYMGYLIFTGADETKLYAADGTLLTTFPTGEIVCANTRDTLGNPLFYKEANYVRTYLRFDEQTGDFVAVDYVDGIHDRGVNFDYPVYYGVSDNDLRRVLQITKNPNGTESRLWAYGFSAAWRRTGYFYTGAYNFSEGFACILDADGMMTFLKDDCYYAFYPRKSYNYYDRYVSEYWLPPLTSGEESIGFFYFDHGLVRVRRQVVDWWNLTEYGKRLVAIDEDILIDTTGAEFPIPEGYDIISYSDGVILLERDGKYGYMDYTGAWIAQPIYDYARPFFEGLAVAGFEDGERLVLDTNGEIVVPAGIYTHISDMASGVMAAYSHEGGWDVLYKMAKYAEG